MDTASQALVPVEQRTVIFYDDKLVAVRVAGGAVYIPVRPLCEQLGVDWNGQRRRILRDAVLREELRTVDVTSTEGERAVTRGVSCLPVDMIAGFLFGINEDRVKPELRDRVIRYRRECHRVLAEAFREGRLTGDDELRAVVEQGGSEAVQALKMAEALLQLAKSQVRLEGRVDVNERRLERLETYLAASDRFVTDDQAAQISQAVKLVAHALGQRSGRNEYGGVYGELYRRFGITSYKQLPARQFQQAMDFLNQWLQALTGDAGPF